MPFKIELISTSPKSNIGTRAHWDDASQSLFYVDIYGADASILRYDTKENKVYTATVEHEPVVSFIIPIANTTNKYAIGIERRVGIISWDGKSPKVSVEAIAFEVDRGTNETRFNDAKADPSGRFYGGTMRFGNLGSFFEKASGTFYRYTREEGVTELLHNIYISNGMAWNKNDKMFYFIDSCKKDVKQYDYEPANGNISNERILIDFKKDGKHVGFFPDSLTIDTDGFLYVTTWGGSKIFKIDPKQGNIVAEIEFPVKQITSVAFAGPNLDIFYVTTAATNRDGEQPPLSGHLFKVSGLNAKGFPGVKVRL